MHPAYKQMLKVAEAYGLPKNYREDLTIHDPVILRDHPDCQFVWLLYRNGTHFLRIGLFGDNQYPWDEQKIAEEWFDAVAHNFDWPSNTPHWFVWDGIALCETSQADARTWYVNKIMELFYATNAKAA